MGFHYVEYPLAFGYGTRSGFGWKTIIHESDGGQEQRIARRSIFRKEYDGRTGIRSLTDLNLIRHFVAARKGSLNSFLLRDPLDRTTGLNDISAPTSTDVTIGTGDGSTTTFQLVKRYGDMFGVNWPIKLPVSGTVVVALDGVDQVEGVDFTVNTITGEITFATAPGSGVDITAGCEFRVPVRFKDDIDDLFDISIEEFEVGDIPAIGMIEEMHPVLITDEYDYGDADELDLSAAPQIANPLTRVLAISDATNSLVLPPVIIIPLGGPIFVVTNNDVSNSLTIVDQNLVTVATLAPGATKQIWLMKVSSVKQWLLV